MHSPVNTDWEHPDESTYSETCIASSTWTSGMASRPVLCHLKSLELFPLSGIVWNSYMGHLGTFFFGNGSFCFANGKDAARVGMLLLLLLLLLLHLQNHRHHLLLHSRWSDVAASASRRPVHRRRLHTFDPTCTRGTEVGAFEFCDWHLADELDFY